MVDLMTEAASSSGEGQSMHRLYEKIFAYTHQQLSATLHEAPAAERETREAASYFYRTLLSNPGDWKNTIKLDLPASISIHPVFNILLLKKYYRDRLLPKVVQVEDDAKYKIDLILHHQGYPCY